MLKKCFFLFLIAKLKRRRVERGKAFLRTKISMVTIIKYIMKGRKQAESVNSDLPQGEDQETELLGKYRKEASTIISGVDV